MATVRLYAPDTSGAIEFLTDDAPEEVHAYLESLVGTWKRIPGVSGAILIGEEWWADYFIGAPDEFDPYPDYRLTGAGSPSFSELGPVAPC